MQVRVFSYAGSKAMAVSFKHALQHENKRIRLMVVAQLTKVAETILMKQTVYKYTNKLIHREREYKLP